MFFGTPAEFRRWLERHHATAGELWVGYWKKGIKELIRAGRLRPAGLRAFQARDPNKSRVYSFERRSEARLPSGLEARFRAQPAAAKREETRAKRLATLIEDSAAKRRIAPLRRPEKFR